MKRILSACLVQTLLFDSPEEADLFDKQLSKKRIPHHAERTEILEDGTVSVQMRRRYVHYPVGDYIPSETEA